MSFPPRVKFFAVAILLQPVLLVPAVAQSVVTAPNSIALETVQLLENGEQLLNAGQYAAAESRFYEAFQSSRTNNGFYSAEQIVILEYIMAAALKRGNWDDFLHRAGYLEQLSLQLFAKDPERRLAALQTLSSWHLAAAAAMDEERSVWHFIKSRNLLWLAVSQIEGQSGRYDSRLSPLLYQIALNHYYMARSTQRRRITSYELRTDSPAFVSGWSLRGTEALLKNYEIGLELLQRIRAISAGNSPSDSEMDGMSLLYLADWNLLFGRGGDALEGYYQAYDRLQMAGIPVARLDEFFSRRVLLPAPNLVLALPGTQAPAKADPIVFRHWSAVLPGVEAPSLHPFTLLNESGAVAAGNIGRQVGVALDLQIAGADSVGRGGQFGNFNYQIADMTVQDNARLSDAELTGALAELAELQFRPILLSGEAVSVQDVKVQYILAD